MLVVATGLLGGMRETDVATPARRARVHRARRLGTGIGLVAGGSFGAVVGAGLIGGAVGLSRRHRHRQNNR